MSDDELHNESGGGLDAAAAAWVARADRGALSAEDAEALEQWLAEDSRHRGAYARAQAAFAYMNADLAAAMDEIDMPAFAPAQPAATTPVWTTPSWPMRAWLAQAAPIPDAPIPDAQVSRRRFLWIGGSAGAVAAASVAALALKPEALPITYSAQRGEIRHISLADGSVVTLDTASTVVVQYLKHRRNVELVTGRALFDVAKDKTRPFTVTAGGLKVQAVGTSFVVRNAVAHAPEVLVQEGIVDVGQQAEKAPVRVGANMRVTASAAGPALHVVSVDPAAVARELAWRQGMLAFEDVSLAVVAEEFARYSDARIIIPDPKLASVTITGLFAADNPLGFAHAAALSLGLTLDIKGHDIRLGRT